MATLRSRSGSTPRLGPWMGFAVGVVRPLSTVFTRRDWQGQHHIPRAGGVIVAANHLSWADPFLFGHFVYKSGRIPRYLAKESLFRARVVGRLVRGAGQIPVHRGARDGAAALGDAVAALHRGEAVLIYPEGTITKDPDAWPMQARTGVARLALLSGAPIVPVAQWGAQEVLDRSGRLHLLPRKLIRIHALEPIQPALPAAGQAPTREAVRALTDDVMHRIRAELEVLRAEPAPTGIWDPRLRERVPAAAGDAAGDQGAA